MYLSRMQYGTICEFGNASARGGRDRIRNSFVSKEVLVRTSVILILRNNHTNGPQRGVCNSRSLTIPVASDQVG